MRFKNFRILGWLSLIASMSCIYIPKTKPFAYCNDLLVATNHAIEIFPGSSTGATTPTRTVSDTVVVTQAYGVTVDSINLEMYLTDATTGTITVYDLEAPTGTQTPKRKITGLTTPRGIAVDPIHDEIFVVSGTANTLKVFSRTATGAATALRTITSNGTSLRQPIGVALDLFHDEVFISAWQDDSIQTYPRTATGAYTPTREFSGANTHISNVSQIVYDLRNDQLIVASEYPGIGFFKRTAQGNIAPDKEITGATTTLTTPSGLAIDFITDQILVLDSGTVNQFYTSDDGDVAPASSFTDSTLTGGLQTAFASCNSD